MQLNAAQQQVVNELDRNILLLASAGTGKTNTLSHRVAHILESGRATGEDILCLTFTNKACREMKERMLSIVGQQAQAVKVSTFHSFCYTILQEEAKLQEDLFSEFLIMDEEDTAELIGEFLPALVKERNLGNTPLIIHKDTIQRVIGVVKEYRSVYGYYSDDVQMDYIQTIETLYDKDISMLRQAMGSSVVEEFFRHSGIDVMMDYERRLRGLNGLDFTDLITRVHQLFQRPDVAQRWRHRYSYIAVDEMQDTSRLEYDVMNVMWPGNHVLLCGDYFQTIYEWRGSDPLALIKDFRKDYEPIGIVFNENYRANQTLFKASFAMLQQVFPELVADMYERLPRAVAKESGSPIVVYEGATAYKEAAYIFDALRALRTSQAMPPAGILVRFNYQAKELSQLFETFNKSLPESERLRFILVDELKFFRRQEVKDILSFFKVLANPRDVMSAKRMIRKFVTGVGEQKIKELESSYVRETGLRITDFMSTHIFEQEPYERLERALLAKDVVVFDVESTGVNVMEDRIIQMAAIRIDETGQVVDTFEEFINPGVPVGESEQVHGFSDAYLAEHGRPPEIVLQEFSAFAQGAVIVGHNVTYDMSILEQECIRHHVAMPTVQAVYDTLNIYRRFYPNLRNHKLGYLSEHFPIDHKPTHNAMDDILATAKLLIYAMKNNIIPTKAQRMGFVNKYRAYFGKIASAMDTLRRKMLTSKPTELLTYIMKDMGVAGYYESKVTGDSQGRQLQSIRELYTIFRELEEENPEYVGRDGIQVVLELSALNAGEGMFRRKGDDRIPIITVHQAKGSEFDHVFLAGVNDSAYPSYRAVQEGRISEEQRIFYVALTRAKQHLTITYHVHRSKKRDLMGSRFIQCIPREYLDFHQ